MTDIESTVEPLEQRLSFLLQVSFHAAFRGLRLGIKGLGFNIL